MRAFVATMLLVAGLLPALAHMHERPDLTDWLRSLYSVHRGSCCDNSEAETMADPDWRNASEFPDAKGNICAESSLIEKPNVSPNYNELIKPDYCVRLENPETHEWAWWAIPHSAIVELPNRAGPALIWHIWVSESGTPVGPRRIPYIRCFLPGSGA